MARQRLGQHFLVSAAWRERILRAILASSHSPAGARSESGVWIEIGAGHGEMTAMLAQHAARVVAIELDAKLLPYLRQTAAGAGNVTVVAGDILKQNFGALAGEQPFRVYGNLPYYISSPIVHHLFDRPARMEGAFFVVQLEVAKRMAATPGTRDYGYLSAFVQFHARTEILLRIPPGAFRPRPEVDSALIALHTPGEKAALPIPDENAFLRFVKLCFAQKRKTLRNNLRAIPGTVSAERVLQASGLTPDARAEQLNLGQFASLFRASREGRLPEPSRRG